MPTCFDNIDVMSRLTERLPACPNAAANRMHALRNVVLIATAALALALTTPSQARRLALVIGNDGYQNVQTLRNARADARAVAVELRATGFEVTLKEDVTQKVMQAALRDFTARVAGGDDVVFYFSGHGVQFEGTNYLLPVDINPDSEARVADDAVPLNRVLEDLTKRNTRFSLAIIDACRTNPFKEAGRAIGERGLAPVAPATGQMIMYSAGTGQAALDVLGDGDKNPNGLFTRVLIQEMRKTGVPAGDMLKDVQGDVVQLADGIGKKQVPALYDQSLGKFYFRPGAAEAGGGAPAAAAIHLPTAAELDESYWQGIKGSTDASDFSACISSFPKGMHLAEAQMMQHRLAKSAAPKAMPVSSAAPAATAAPAGKLMAGGPYPGWGTSSLLPGVVGHGTVTVNKDGSIDTDAPNGDRVHATLNISDPSNIVGTAVTHLGIQGGVQRRYPDGSVSTQVTIQGRLATGVITGTYYDKFQSGQFQWTVAPSQ
jgi:uncharacterized caspase-like protein